jgi:hypothetical protein
MTWTPNDDPDHILAQTTALLVKRGDEQSVALLVDVQSMEFLDSDEVALRSYDDTWEYWTNEYYKVATFDVEDHLVDRFTDDVVARILPPLVYVADRNGVKNVKHFQARPALPEVDDGWRKTFLARLSADRPTNQARRERDLPQYPMQDALTFGSAEELLVYKSLRRLQDLLPKDASIAILPLPGTRFQNGSTRTPDFLVTGRGRAVVIEVDGPHHRAPRRRVDDANLDLQWIRCGIPVIRLAVEDITIEKELDDRLCEEFRRHLPPARRAA